MMVITIPRRSALQVHEYELYRDWYIFVEDVWPQEYGRWPRPHCQPHITTGHA